MPQMQIEFRKCFYSHVNEKNPGLHLLASPLNHVRSRALNNINQFESIILIQL